MIIKCHYAECHAFLIVMLNVSRMSVVMLNVVAPKIVNSGAQTIMIIMALFEADVVSWNVLGF
jgi:hypothetical protein